MDIAYLVRAVVASYEDASKLVNRIQDQRQKSENRASSNESVQFLLESFILGPIIIHGHYDNDVKRFGEAYACGDVQAREQMKDVLIKLQMTLISTLRNVLIDDMELDCTSLQNASDDCRVNAGVCLGQLSQRLSAQTIYSQPMMNHSQGNALMQSISPSLAYSSSQSTYSSGNYQVPRTPDPIADQFAALGITSAVRKPCGDRKLSNSSAGSQSPYIKSPAMRRSPPESQSTLPVYGVNTIPSNDVESLRRPSSHTLAPEDNLLISPVAQLTHSPGIHDTDRASYVSNGKDSQNQSSPDMSRTSSSHRATNPKERLGQPNMNINGQELNYGTIYDVYQNQIPNEAQQVNSSYSNRAQESNHSTLEHIRYLQDNSRPPAHGMYHIMTEPKPALISPEYYRKPVSSNKTAMSAIPPRHIGRRSSISTPIPADPFNTKPTLHSPAQKPPQPPTQGPIPSLIKQGPLILPTDKNLQGFCKGAFRLQVGLEKKAFTIANRPSGISGMISYWRCDKCNFEGPVNQSVISDGKKKGKPEKIFDPKIRTSISGGIRYKWIFLAKSHVVLKGLVDGNRDGSFGSFGCLFCSAEGQSRGWTGGNNAGISSNGGTPIFGNVTSFMEHLEMHRDEAGWPNAEMLGRMKCVVAGETDRNESWDINFVPTYPDS